MASLPATNLRKGQVLEFKDDLWMVVSADHRTPGNLRAFIQTKLKNLQSGVIINERFSASDKITTAYLDGRQMEFLYKDGENFVFMDQETYEQVMLGDDLVGDLMGYVKHNSEVKVVFHDEKPISVELPTSVELRVERCDPAVKGDTKTNVTKDAELETGLVIQVPMYMKPGELVKVDTREGTFIERVQE